MAPGVQHKTGNNDILSLYIVPMDNILTAFKNRLIN